MRSSGTASCIFKEVDFFFSGSGILPQFYRGWKPLPQRTNILGDKVAPSAINRFSARNVMRMTTGITQIVSAYGLPTTGKKQEFGIMY
jgi:hypothetical protein